MKLQLLNEGIHPDHKSQFLRELGSSSDSFSSIGRKYGISPVMAHKYAKNLGIPRRKAFKPTQQQVSLAKKLFRQNKTYQEVMTATGLRQTDVKRIFNSISNRNRVNIRKAIKTRNLEKARLPKEYDGRDILDNLLSTTSGAAT